MRKCFLKFHLTRLLNIWVSSAPFSSHRLFFLLRNDEKSRKACWLIYCSRVSAALASEVDKDKYWNVKYFRKTVFRSNDALKVCWKQYLWPSKTSSILHISGDFYSSLFYDFLSSSKAIPWVAFLHVKCLFKVSSSFFILSFIMCWHSKINHLIRRAGLFCETNSLRIPIRDDRDKDISLADSYSRWHNLH